MTIWQHRCEQDYWCWDVVFECSSSVIQKISGTAEWWLAEHLAFVVETYFKNNDSVIFTQRIFNWHSSIHRNDSVASRSTLLLWVRNLRERASAAKRKPTEREPVVRTPENIKLLRQTFVGKSSAIRKQECPCIKNVWPHSALNIVSRLKLVSLQNYYGSIIQLSRH